MTAGVERAARRFTYARQFAPGRDALAVLRDLVGVYSSHPTAPLALRARVPGLTAAAFAALEARRAVVRLPAMRGSIHLVAREDAALARGIAPRIDAYTRTAFAHAGMDAAQLPAWGAALAAAAQEPLAAKDAVAAAGIDVPEPSLLCTALARDGVLVRVGAPSLRANALRYVSAAAWLGGPLPAPLEDGLAALARRYLAAYGPARVEDFRWWSSATPRAAAAAVAAHATVDVGDGLLVLAGDEAACAAAPPVPRGTVDLLPKWDALTMGHAPDGRARLVPPGATAYDWRGDGLPLVLVEGVARASWTLRGGTVEVDWFEPPGVRARARTERAFGALATFLGTTLAVGDARDPGAAARRGG